LHRFHDQTGRPPSQFQAARAMPCIPRLPESVGRTLQRHVPQTVPARGGDPATLAPRPGQHGRSRPR
jgi:hypothetical protein